MNRISKLFHVPLWRGTRRLSIFSQPVKVKRSFFWRWSLRTGVGLCIGTTGWFSIDYLANCRLSQLSDKALPRKYDAEAIKSYWEKERIVVLRRCGQIFFEAVPTISRYFISNYLFSNTEKSSSTDLTQYGVDLRLILTRLGPAFIKFGQLLSIRPDVLPIEIILELRKLCDSVPAFDTREALQIIEKEIGCDPSELFNDLDENTTPVAAASLGQETGEKVAVKVQRPDMLHSVSLDLFIMRKYMSFVEVFKAFLMNRGFMAQRKQFNVNLLDTFATASYLELDYLNEAANAVRFQTELIPKMPVGSCKIPNVYFKLSSRRVLTTEWIQGIRLCDSDPATIQRLVPIGVQCFFAQMLETGFFHADPHPGNLLVNSKGELVLIDFGLCAELITPNSNAMANTIINIIHGNVEGLISDAIILGFLPEDVDTTTLLPALQRIFDKMKLSRQKNSKNITKKEFLSAERRKSFQAVTNELNQIFFEYPFVVPPYFALFTRALILLEGIALSGDPQFDIFSTAYPYARQHAVNIFGVTTVTKLAGVGLRAHINNSSQK